MRDEIVRAITADGYVKAVAVTGRELVERARNIHSLPPMATAALQELGYTPAEIAAALKGADPNASTEDLIRHALRTMMLKKM